jgi:L-rhamnose isomerase/sugar isomerase
MPKATPASSLDLEYSILGGKLAAKGIDIDRAAAQAMAFRCETPSWGYGNQGTRFGVVRDPAAPRDAFEKFADAAQVHRVTGIAPTVAVHIPWDKVADFTKLQKHAKSLGVAIGAVNPNVFQDEDYRFGSACNSDPRVRRKAVAHMKECVGIAKETGSTLLSLWFADGTSHPGQGDFARRKNWLLESLAEVYRAMPKGMRMLVEYKFFEPAFYHTDLPDWGLAYLAANRLGPQAQVLVDLGHHAQGTNIEWIIGVLLDEGKLGGFHFNNRKYADDDLTTGSINPYELFLIFHELVSGAAKVRPGCEIAYMIDESPILKPRIEAMIQSVMNIQEAYAKALIVDRQALRRAQDEHRIVDAERCLWEAFMTDVTPLLAKGRIAKGLDPDPLAAHRKSGYYEKIRKARAGKGKAAAGLGTG